MSIDVSDLRATIVPKSDQLNAEQLLTGPITVTVSEVRLTSSEEQPVIVHYENDNGRPFKPCKTMRKVLVLAWGEDGRAWAGRSMTLYQDPNVKFGGAEVGGIRISHLTDIERDIRVSLTATKGKKALYEVKRMESPDARSLDAIRIAATPEALKDVFGRAWKAAGKDKSRRAPLKRAYDARLSILTNPPKIYSRFADDIDNAVDIEGARVVLDQARDALDASENAALAEHFKQRWEQQ